MKLHDIVQWYRPAPSRWWMRQPYGLMAVVLVMLGLMVAAYVVAGN